MQSKPSLAEIEAISTSIASYLEEEKSKHCFHNHFLLKHNRVELFLSLNPVTKG